MARSDLLTVTGAGLYCAAGDFYVDPWLPVPRAVITHAHSDHARWGSERYLTTPQGRLVLQNRMGPQAQIDTLPYGESLTLGNTKVSLHPAGHVLGSAQVRIEQQGEVWVASGDYKTAFDPTCDSFEPVRCDTFITESTFGLPIYRWVDTSDVVNELTAWWQANRAEGVVSILFTYALGKAQRMIASIGDSIGPILCHGAVESVNASYRATGVSLPHTSFAGRGEGKKSWDGALVVAPPSAAGSSWLRKFGDISTAFASGWMLVRGSRRRRNVDRGFVVSDHADWPGLCSAITATGAQRVLVTHGSTAAMSHWLTEQGIESRPLETRFEGEVDESPEPSDGNDEGSSPPTGGGADDAAAIAGSEGIDE